MPNVRHEEPIEGITMPEITQTSAQEREGLEHEDPSQKGDSHACQFQYREDLQKQA